MDKSWRLRESWGQEGGGEDVMTYQGGSDEARRDSGFPKSRFAGGNGLRQRIVHIRHKDPDLTQTQEKAKLEVQN